MPRDNGALRISVRLEPADFPAYLLLNRQFAEFLAQARPKRTGWWGAAATYLVAYFGVPVLSTLMLALLWAPDLPAFVPELVAVFIVVWLASFAVMQVMHWRTDSIETAALRTWFDASQGMEHELIFDDDGFSVAGDAFSGRFSWSDGPVRCRRWANHLVVLHPRLPVLIPTRAIDGSVKEVFGQLQAWSGSGTS
ncbi:hypothetical protein [Flavimaricola marinus]|uniref:YcxB-like protein domain-containing protein n=1 Tax=Flavimaricola marinus TaxID=1819565 RepID=A0A238LG88_9RHOB|nr:hypothetical protein [Flavimaricola marinus]SMY08583.1 hypothetical protein LOM8899_02737 [Flavimaricola marinus]